jgi:uncharacterized membrane protein YkoI
VLLASIEPEQEGLPLNRLFAAVVLLAAVLMLAPATAPAAATTLKDAIAKVERETGAKVLSAETRHSGKQTVYRIKVLTHEGQVKVIEVPAGD